jgi:hypothetical protein
MRQRRAVRLGLWRGVSGVGFPRRRVAQRGAANRTGAGALRQWALMAAGAMFNLGAGLKCSVAGLGFTPTLLVAASVGVRWRISMHTCVQWRRFGGGFSV